MCYFGLGPTVCNQIKLHRDGIQFDNVVFHGGIFIWASWNGCQWNDNHRQKYQSIDGRPNISKAEIKSYWWKQRKRGSGISSPSVFLLFFFFPLASPSLLSFLFLLVFLLLLLFFVLPHLLFFFIQNVFFLLLFGSRKTKETRHPFVCSYIGAPQWQHASISISKYGSKMLGEIYSILAFCLNVLYFVKRSTLILIRWSNLASISKIQKSIEGWCWLMAALQTTDTTIIDNKWPCVQQQPGQNPK